MQCKYINDSIVCIRCKNGEMQFLPRFESVPLDDRIPWEQTDKEYVRLPDFSAFVLDDDPRLLEGVKREKLVELGASFDERVAGSFTTTQGYKMQFDTSDAIKMEGAIKLLEATGVTEGYLTQADDTTVYNVPLDTMKTVLIEMMSAFAACHARKQELRALINAAETAKDLDEIIISWPV